MVTKPIVGDSHEEFHCSISNYLLSYTFADCLSMSRGFHSFGPCLRSLRSRLPPRITGVSPAHGRFYAVPADQPQSHESPSSISVDAQQRWNELRELKCSLYPRVSASNNITSCREFSARYANLDQNETVNDKDVTLCGMCGNQRSGAGSSDTAHASRKDTLVPCSRPEACLSRHRPG